MAEISLVDTHCHVDFDAFDEDREAVFERMRENGVDRAVVVSVELAQVPGLKSFVEAHPGTWFSVGIHPNHEVAQETSVDELCALAGHPKCVAIGETGMDFFRHRVEPEVQADRFRTHLRAAKALNKPVIVHMRDADEATMDILREEKVGDCGGIMHCFSSTLDVARQALDLGMSISFSGNVTFKRNEELREVAAQIPLESILVETDAPYLAPVPHRGKRNEPTYVRHVAECIAEVRGVPMADLAAATTANAIKRFGLQ